MNYPKVHLGSQLRSIKIPQQRVSKGGSKIVLIEW